MIKLLKIGGLCLVCLTIGWFAKLFFEPAHLLLIGDGSLRCAVGKQICVGDSLNSLPDQIGGVQAVFCGSDGQGDFIFFPEFMNQRCKRPDMAVVFSDGVRRTVIWLHNGVVVKVTRGPLHIIDF